jgi:hypothetical protein
MNPANQPKAGLTNSKLFILTRRCGRLANRLMAFSHFIAWVEEHGHRVMNFTFHSYAHFFDATDSDIFCQYPPARDKSVLNSIPGAGQVIRGTRIFHHAARIAGGLNEWLPLFGRKVVTLRELPGQEITWLDGLEVEAAIRDAKIVFVDGWKLRAPECVQKHAGKIRNYFKPAAIWERASSEAVERLRQRANVVIGVHIRQGDYRNWKGGKFYFPVSRYADWMRELAGQFSGARVSFLVCSDEPRSQEEFSGLTVGFGTNSSVGDLYALAKCDYLLGPQSTFSQWASFYGEKPLFHVRNSDDRLDLTEFRIASLDDF